MSQFICFTQSLCNSFVWSYENILGWRMAGALFPVTVRLSSFSLDCDHFHLSQPRTSVSVCFTFPTLPVCLFRVVCIFVRSLRGCSLVIVSSSSVFRLTKNNFVHIVFLKFLQTRRHLICSVGHSLSFSERTIWPDHGSPRRNPSLGYTESAGTMNS